MVVTQIFFMFNPNFGEDEPILTVAYFCFKWVGSTTTKQQYVYKQHLLLAFKSSSCWKNSWMARWKNSWKNSVIEKMTDGAWLSQWPTFYITFTYITGDLAHLVDEHWVDFYEFGRFTTPFVKSLWTLSLFGTCEILPSVVYETLSFSPRENVGTLGVVPL